MLHLMQRTLGRGCRLQRRAGLVDFGLETHTRCLNRVLASGGAVKCWKSNLIQCIRLLVQGLSQFSGDKKGKTRNGMTVHLKDI